MATSQQDVDWQSTKKTVLERSRHMFNNPLMSDVNFSCEGSDEKFFAHKYVLATSSAVFYAMLYGELAEKNSVVHLSDTNEESLQEFLRYLYTDECNLSTDNAMFVLYLAKKYIVPSLAEKCTEFLEANLASENVFTLLKQAVRFVEEELVGYWDLIDLNTADVVASDAFVDVDKATLAGLVKRESLSVEEVDLFKAVLKWSEAECSRKGIEANAKNKRAAMGNTIYQIRFAFMTSQEFGQNASQSGILAPEEVILFYDVISGVERASEKWNMSERNAKGEVLLRCCRFASYRHCPVLEDLVIPSENTLCVSFSKAVKIHGVHLLGHTGEEYDVKLQVFSQSVKKKLLSQQNSRGIPGFDVMVPVPINVQADVVVHLKATITGVLTGCTGCKGKKKVETNGLTVNFFNTPGEHSGATSVDQGQFDEIIFSKI